MSNVYDEQAKVFKAFCDEKRLNILELLREGEKCACVLMEKLDIPQSSLAYHMKILCESGILESRQQGKWTHYRISKKGSDDAKRLLEFITSTNYIDINSGCCDEEKVRE